MATDDLTERMTRNLSANLRHVREQRGLTQARLAALTGVPRSTVANLEAGGANPTLSVLARLAAALQLSIEELLSTPHAQLRLFHASELKTLKRGTGGAARVRKLLPDPIPGMEIDRMHLAPGASFRGVPHRPGTREYLFCERGRIVLSAAGESLELQTGDVAAFQGDQRHAYANPGPNEAVGFSVVTLAPVG